MLIKMIIDHGNLKKETVYDFDDAKATSLLTLGLCVRTQENLETPQIDEKKKEKKE